MTPPAVSISYEVGAWDLARRGLWDHYHFGANRGLHLLLPSVLMIAGAAMLYTYGWPEPILGRVGFGLVMAGGYFAAQPAARGFARGFIGGPVACGARLQDNGLLLTAEGHPRLVPWDLITSIDGVAGDVVLHTKQGVLYLPLVAQSGDATDFVAQLAEQVSRRGIPS